MPDPVSIATSVLGILTSIVKISFKLNELRSGLSDSSIEIDSFFHVLGDLIDILTRLQNSKALPKLPHNLSRDLMGALYNCNKTVEEAESLLLGSSRSRFRGLEWVRTGEKELVQLSRGVKAHMATIIIIMGFDAEGSESFDETSDFASIAEGKRLVIAIDYGNTFTGVAIAFVPLHEKVAKLEDIKLINEWDNMNNGDKVPSVYSYIKAASGEEQWGSSLSDDAVTVVPTKLELDVQESRLDELELILHNLDGMHDLRFDHVVATKGNPDFTAKKPELVVLDYMKIIFDRVLKYLEQVPEDLLRSLPVDIVITHPMVCSYKTKNALYRAVTLAGFNESAFPKLQDIIMLAEQKAAAMYIAGLLSEKEANKALWKKNSTFILCDAGGVTVDVTTFRVLETEPTLKLQQIGAPHSANCGSIFIDGKFKSWLRDDALGPDGYEKLEPNTKGRINLHSTTGKRMRGITEKFIEYKRSFRGDEDPDQIFTIDLPSEFGYLTQEDWARDGQLTLSTGLMVWLFEPCVDRIVELVKTQAQLVEDYKGGFSESVYLQSAIRKNLEARGIALHRPENSWTTVVRGAAIVGIEKNQLENSVTTARFPYPCGVAQDVEEFSGVAKAQYQDQITGKTMGKNRLSWIVRRGDLAFSEYSESQETLLAFKFLEHGERNFTVSVYKYLEDDDFLPTRVREKDPELGLILSIPINFPEAGLDSFEMYESVRGREPYYQGVVSLFLTWRNESVGATVLWNNNIMYSSDSK